MASTNARLLFGLAAASCSAPHTTVHPSAPASAPAYPLCDRDGAPACGNVGQVGRAHEPARRARIQRVVLGATEMPAATGSLLRSGANDDLAIVRPLRDEDERPMAGNVVGKGRPRPYRERASASLVTYVDDGAVDQLGDAVRERSSSILAEVLAALEAP